MDILSGAFSDSFHNFVEENSDADPKRLIFRKDTGLTPELLRLAVTQIEIRRKHRDKFKNAGLPANFLFPDKIIVEQATNGFIARYNASLLSSGDTVVDLTAGLGIDVIAFARRATQVIAIERDEVRADFLRHNLHISDIVNVKVVTGDCHDWLAGNSGFQADCVYVDPARRDAAGGRVHGLRDCSPDLLDILPMIWNISSKLMVKVSPLLDINLCVNELKNLKEIHIVDYKRVCRELLLVLEKDTDNSGAPAIRCVEIDAYGETMTNDFIYEKGGGKYREKVVSDASEIRPGTYLYEPFPSVVKADVSSQLLEKYPGLLQVGKGVNIYFSAVRVKKFPGREFIVSKHVDKYELKEFAGKPLNVISKFYPLSSEEFSRRYNLIPDGPEYLFALTLHNRKTLLLTTLNEKREVIRSKK